KIPSESRLNVSLQLVQSNSDTGSMGSLHPFISSHKGRQRYALRRREGGIPASTVLHRPDRVALLVHVFPRRLVANQLLSGNRMLTFAEPSKLFLLHRTTQPPLLGQSPAPLAAYPFAFAVVVFLCAAELLLVVRTSLTCTERLGNGKHVPLLEEASLWWLHGVFELWVLTRRLLYRHGFLRLAISLRCVICSRSDCRYLGRLLGQCRFHGQDAGIVFAERNAGLLVEAQDPFQHRAKAHHETSGTGAALAVELCHGDQLGASRFLPVAQHNGTSAVQIGRW